MFFRPLRTLVALAALCAVLPGCAMKSSPEGTQGADGIAAGNAAYERKDYATACEKLFQAGPKAGFATLTRAGDACAKNGSIKAQEAYQAALAANAAYAPALEGAGLTAYAAGDLSQAKELLTAAARAGGTDARAALALADATLLTGNCPKALSLLQAEARRNPGAGAVKVRLGAVRLLCTGARSTAPATSPAASSPDLSQGAAGPAASTGMPPANPKEPAKGKSAPRTIDLNDI